MPRSAGGICSERLHKDAHECAGHDTALAEVMGKPVGRDVHLGVCQAPRELVTARAFGVRAACSSTSWLTQQSVRNGAAVLFHSTTI